jgi:cell division protein FtsB
MRAVKQKKKNIVLRVALAAFAVYVVVQVVSLQIQLRAKQDEVESIQAQIQQQELLNESLKDKVNNYEIYLEEEAREQGYFLPGEQIYQVVPEN